MTTVRLTTVQRCARVRQLDRDGVLVADWSWVPPLLWVGYQRMVTAMAGCGVTTDGRPPVWCWLGDLTLFDVRSLFDPEHELADGYAAIVFDVPTGLAVHADYGAWNDHLDDLLESRYPRREPVVVPIREASTPAGGPEQVCVPLVRSAWVRGVRELPVEGWDSMDPSVSAARA